jgi:peptidoglycan hydrolase-like protein with peptidoglycan-binding domain
MKRLLLSSAAVLATVAFASAQDASQTNKTGGAKPSAPAAAQSANQNSAKGSANQAAQPHGGQQADGGANARHDESQSSQRARGDGPDKSRESAQGRGEEKNTMSSDAQSRAASQGRGEEKNTKASNAPSGDSAHARDEKAKAADAQRAGDKQPTDHAAKDAGASKDQAKDAAARDNADKQHGADKAAADAKSDKADSSAQREAPSRDHNTAQGTSNATPDQRNAQGENANVGARTDNNRVVGANLSIEQRTRIEQTVLARSDVPHVQNVNFALNVGVAVPSQVRVVEVPPALVEIYPDWRGYSYFVVSDEIVIVKPDRHIVAVIPTGRGGSAQVRAEGGGQTYSDAQIREIQRVLISRGLYEGEPDGVLGSRTKQAIVAFQRKQGLQASGEIDTSTVSALGVNVGGSGGGAPGAGRDFGGQSNSGQQSGPSSAAADRGGSAPDNRTDAAQQKPGNAAQQKPDIPNADRAAAQPQNDESGSNQSGTSRRSDVNR